MKESVHVVENIKDPGKLYMTRFMVQSRFNWGEVVDDKIPVEVSVDAY